MPPHTSSTPCCFSRFFRSKHQIWDANKLSWEIRRERARKAENSKENTQKSLKNNKPLENFKSNPAMKIIFHAEISMKSAQKSHAHLFKTPRCGGRNPEKLSGAPPGAFYALPCSPEGRNLGQIKAKNAWFSTYLSAGRAPSVAHWVRARFRSWNAFKKIFFHKNKTSKSQKQQREIQKISEQI